MSPEPSGSAGTVFLRTTRDIAPDEQPFSRLSDAVGNTGNYFFEHALLRHISDAQVVHAVEDVPDRVERLVLSMANFVSATTDLGYVVDCLERKAIRQVVMIGAGAQAYDYGEGVTLTAGTRRFLSFVADRSVSIGVRGHYTAEVLNDLGVRNVTVIGCPAAFWSGALPPAIRTDTLPYLPRLAINATPVGHYRDKVSALFGFGMRHEADYLVQAEHWVAELADSLDTGPYVPAWAGDAVSYFAYPACTPTVLARWLRAHAKWFVSPQAWIDDMRQYDLSVGSRFHGNMAAIQAGTPALNLVFDTRTRELCDYLALPAMLLADFHSDMPPDELHARADYRPFIASYPRRFEAYRAFLTDSGLGHTLSAARCSATPPPSSLADRVQARVVRQLADDRLATGAAGPGFRDTLDGALQPMRSRQDREAVESGERLPCAV